MQHFNSERSDSLVPPHKGTTQERKQEIARALTAHQERTGCSQNALAGLTGISPSYISHILAANWDAVPAGGGKTTAISDAMWAKMERALGLTDTVLDTANLTVVAEALAVCKKTAACTIIDGGTGAGKTFAVETFRRTNPVGTFVLKCTNSANPNEFIGGLCAAVGVQGSANSTKGERLRLVADKLLREPSGLLVVDEAEAIAKKPLLIGYLKDLFDLVEGRAAVVIVGAHFWRDLSRRAEAGSGCYPQVQRRFGAEPVLLGAMTLADIKLIGAHYGVTDARAARALVRSGDQVGHLVQRLRMRTAEAITFQHGPQAEA